jgi:hypothetical protein
MQHAPMDYTSPQYYQMLNAMERGLREISRDEEGYFQQRRRVHYEDQDVETDPHAEIETVSDLEDQGEA